MNIQKTLLRREMWEHKGGFLWAPLVACVLLVVITLGGMIAGPTFAHRAGSDTSLVVGGRQVNSMQIGEVLSNLPAHQAADVGQAVNIALWVAAAWPFLVLAFVAFFYCIAALYDERKDRSVLFWKSMPISDRETVISKALSVLVMAPVIAACLGALSMLVLFGLMSLWVVFHGANPASLLWGAANPLGVIVQLFGSLPIYALWALPTAGWLMLCSSFARSKPFLWAILIPVMLGVMVSMLEIGNSGWVWHNIVQRALLGFVPGSWLSDASSHASFPLSLSNTYEALASPAIWIGAIVGVGMLMLAANVRRWKDEG